MHASVEIKDFNELINNKPFFDGSGKRTKQKVYENLIKMSINDDYTTGNSVNYMDHQKYFKLIGMDFSRQTNTCIPQQINFAGNVEEDDVTAMFFIAKRRKKLF